MLIVKYVVKKITEVSQHEAVNYMEDEEMLIVEEVLTGQWWPADEFFHQNDFTSFYTETEEG